MFCLNHFAAQQEAQIFSMSNQGGKSNHYWAQSSSKGIFSCSSCLDYFYLAIVHKHDQRTLSKMPDQRKKNHKLFFLGLGIHKNNTLYNRCRRTRSSQVCKTCNNIDHLLQIKIGYCHLVMNFWYHILLVTRNLFQ